MTELEKSVFYNSLGDNSGNGSSVDAKTQFKITGAWDIHMVSKYYFTISPIAYN